jgi:hypothetical protein
MNLAGNRDKAEAAKIRPGSKPSAAAPGPRPPDCIYLYYLTPGVFPHPTITAFIDERADPIKPGKIAGAIRQLARQAWGGDLQSKGAAISAFPWRRRSYLAFVLDDPDHRFESNLAVMIKGGSHTFTRHELIDFTTPDGIDMQAIYFRNYMRKKNKQELGQGEREDFKIYIELSDARLQPAIPAEIVNHEDTGQNLGPPIPP